MLAAIKKSHIQLPLFQCDECLQTYTREDSLIRHKKKQCKKNNKICSICLKEFQRPWLLERHKKTHQKHQTAKCVNCGRYIEIENCEAHGILCKVERPIAVLNDDFASMVPIAR